MLRRAKENLMKENSSHSLLYCFGEIFSPFFTNSHPVKILSCLAGLFFIISSCENDPKEIKALTQNVRMKEEARAVDSYLSQDGKVKARLRAPLMYRLTTDSLYVEFPQSLHCDFYNDSAQVETRLDSKYGKYFENLNKVYLRDSVIVINTKGDTLLCPDLWWDQNTKLFYTDKYTVYHGVNKNFDGRNGMTATQDLHSIIFNNTVGAIKVSDSGFPDK